MRSSDYARFFSKVSIDPRGCWEWTASTRSGYGAFKLSHRIISAHRLSYRIFYGEDAGQMLVCHKCDNKRCINPEHLFLGTYSDNLKDSYDKGIRPIQDLESFKKGHIPAHRLLTDSDALKVKNTILNRGAKTLRQISEEIGVPYQTIRDISSGRSYINI